MQDLPQYGCKSGKVPGFNPTPSPKNSKSGECHRELQGKPAPRETQRKINLSICKEEEKKKRPGKALYMA